MTTIVNRPSENHDPLNGKMHDLFSGRVGESITTPRATIKEWKDAPRGSLHLYEDTQGAAIFMKAESNNVANDWAIPVGVLQETINYSDMTDATATGTYTFTDALPAGASVLRCHVLVTGAFLGDTSATITVGDGSGNDVDRYNTGTPSVFTLAAEGVDMGVPSGVPWNATALSPIVIVTTNADFTSVTAGIIVVRLFYIR